MSTWMQPAPVPVRECEPWCDKGSHDITEHPVDRYCYSAQQGAVLSLHEPERYDPRGGWCSPWVAAYLRRWHAANEPHVVVFMEETDAEVMLTIDEARQLMQALTETLAQAEVTR